MAATFPYRGVPAGMPPGVPPPAPVPDYMSEEKLQEKGTPTFAQCDTVIVWLKLESTYFIFSFT